MAKNPPPRPLYLTPYDHAFASGPVFFRPASREAALAQFERPEDGDLLWRVFEAFHDLAVVGEGLRLSLNARIVSKNPGQTVTIGANCAIRGAIRCERGGSVAIGDMVYVGDNVVINAQTHVSVGNLTLLAHGVQIFDNNSHPVDSAEREAHFKSILGLPADRSFKIAAKPVSIGRRCWLGFNCAVMKGVTVGDEVIVAAGGVVVAGLPARTLAAGNPAVVVKALGQSAKPGGMRQPFGRLPVKAINRIAALLGRRGR